MRVPDIKEVAIHAVPESCAVHREVYGEALTGVRVGQPLSHEMFNEFWVPTLLLWRKATCAGASLQVPARPNGVREPGMYVRSLHGNREICELTKRWRKPALVRIGNLHYAFDLWANQWRQRHARGNVVIVRYADDIVIGLDKQADATKFLQAMKARLEQFGLTLHPEKTRMIEFGRFAAQNRSKRGQGKPQTFDFLGFTHISGCDRWGKFLLRRITRRDRMIAALKRIKEELRRRWHNAIPEQGQWLRQVMQGYFGYHAVSNNSLSLKTFKYQVTYLWRQALRRRGQRDRTTWAKVFRLAKEWLPDVRILHPWPNVRFDAKHPRQEPGARIAPAGICAGGIW